MDRDETRDKVRGLQAETLIAVPDSQNFCKDYWESGPFYDDPEMQALEKERVELEQIQNKLNNQQRHVEEL